VSRSTFELDALRLLRLVEQTFCTNDDLASQEPHVAILREGLRCARDDLRFLAAASRQLEISTDSDLAAAFTRAEDRASLALALYEFKRDHADELREIGGGAA
jgi:hypothetical protein